jgi:hypothetical protein
MELGTPVPDNVQELPLDALYKLHATMWDEHNQVKAKRALLKPHIDRAEMAKQLATRASFDTVLKVGPTRYTLDDAKQTIALAAKGLFNLPGELTDRLKKVIASGKDEE